MADGWYYTTEAGARVGPIPLAGLQDLVREGSVRPTDLVRAEGVSDWTPASQIGQLRSFFSNGNAPMGANGAAATSALESDLTLLSLDSDAPRNSSDNAPPGDARLAKGVRRVWPRLRGGAETVAAFVKSVAFATWGEACRLREIVALSRRRRRAEGVLRQLEREVGARLLAAGRIPHDAGNMDAQFRDLNQAHALASQTGQAGDKAARAEAARLAVALHGVHAECGRLAISQAHENSFAFEGSAEVVARSGQLRAEVASITSRIQELEKGSKTADALTKSKVYLGVAACVALFGGLVVVGSGSRQHSVPEWPEGPTASASLAAPGPHAEVARTGEVGPNSRAATVAAAMERLGAKVGRDGAGRVTALDLRANPKLIDADLKELVAFKGLKELNLEGTQVSDAGLKELASLADLAVLNLNSTAVTDDGLKHLASLAGLTELRLDDTRLTDEGLKTLASLRKLRLLGAVGTAVTADGAAALIELLPTCQIEGASREMARVVLFPERYSGKTLAFNRVKLDGRIKKYHLLESVGGGQNQYIDVYYLGLTSAEGGFDDGFFLATPAFALKLADLLRPDLVYTANIVCKIEMMRVGGGMSSLKANVIRVDFLRRDGGLSRSVRLTK